MLENVSNDISSTHYSIRRNTFGNEKGIARKKKDELKEETKQEIEQMEGKRSVEANSPVKVEQKEMLQPRYIFNNLLGSLFLCMMLLFSYRNSSVE